MADRAGGDPVHVLEVLDSSIVNVALPHMQGSFSASVDEVAWVVTTYLVAAGIMIPTTGWIAADSDARTTSWSVSTFVVSSAVCGAAQSLKQMVAFRSAGNRGRRPAAAPHRRS